MCLAVIRGYETWYLVDIKRVFKSPLQQILCILQKQPKQKEKQFLLYNWSNHFCLQENVLILLPYTCYINISLQFQKA